MSKRKLFLVLAMSTSLVAASFSGCAKSSDNDSSLAKEATDSKSGSDNEFKYSNGDEAPSGTTVSGCVSAIEDNEITLSVMGGAPQGSAPQATADGEEPPAMPDGQEPPAKPDEQELAEKTNDDEATNTSSATTGDLKIANAVAMSTASVAEDDTQLSETSQDSESDNNESDTSDSSERKHKKRHKSSEDSDSDSEENIESDSDSSNKDETKKNYKRENSSDSDSEDSSDSSTQESRKTPPEKKESSDTDDSSDSKKSDGNSSEKTKKDKKATTDTTNETSNDTKNKGNGEDESATDKVTDNKADKETKESADKSDSDTVTTGKNEELTQQSSTEENQTQEDKTEDVVKSTDDTNAPLEMPDAEDGGGQAPDGMMGQESEAVLTINDESVLYKAVDGEENSISLEDISEGDFITITFDEDGNITKIVVENMSEAQEGMGRPDGNEQGGPSGQAAVTSYDSVITATDGQTVTGDVTSQGTDENAVLVDSDVKVNIKNANITRNSSDSTGGDSASFYGVGAAVLATDGEITIKDSTITTDAKGGAGVFAYGDGVVNVSDTTINTTESTSGGIHVAGGGTLNASNLTVETNGESAAAIRSDRGGGTMTVNGGSYTSNGVGSPSVYCTADITVNDADLTATGSEAVCIEGLNSLKLTNCNLTGNMKDLDTNDTTWNIIVYQSMSGDAEVGNSTFEMIGGTLTAGNGGMIYTTNTECTILLSDVDITYADDSEFFLRCTGNANERGWGSTGKNGSQCNFTANKQQMEGLVVWDSISTLDFYMTDGSILTGAVTDDESCAGDGGDGYCNLYIDESSKWIVTQDSTLTNLYCAGTIEDATGKTVTVQGADGTVYVKGTSDVTITVDSYSNTADVKGAIAVE